MYSSIERSRPFLDLDMYWSISSSSLDLLYRLDFIIYWSKSRSRTFRFRSLLPNRKLFLRRPESDFKVSLEIWAKNFIYRYSFACKNGNFALIVFRIVVFLAFCRGGGQNWTGVKLVESDDMAFDVQIWSIWRLLKFWSRLEKSQISFSLTEIIEAGARTFSLPVRVIFLTDSSRKISLSNSLMYIMSTLKNSWTQIKL